jgi:hypothetical protein
MRAHWTTHMPLPSGWQQLGLVHDDSWPLLLPGCVGGHYLNHSWLPLVWSTQCTLPTCRTAYLWLHGADVKAVIAAFVNLLQGLRP